MTDAKAGDKASHLKHGGIEAYHEGEDHSTAGVCDTSVTSGRPAVQ